MVRPGFVTAVLCIGLTCVTVGVTAGQTAPVTCRLAAIGEPGRYIGFDINVNGDAIAQLRFCSRELVTAATATVGGDAGLSFAGFAAARDSGVTLGPNTRVSVRPGPAADPYPAMDFSIDLRAFDPVVWQQAQGETCPFHFLTLATSDAEAIHHRGFLVATPRLDPYALRVGRQGLVASRWSRNWTWAPPFGACPIPEAGLWAAGSGRYVAYDFMEARLTDHTEKFLASSYCWRDGHDFIALVYPFANQYVSLVHPIRPVTVASHCRILYNLSLPSWRDPNQWYHQRLWSRYADRLPGAPLLNDMSWLPGNRRGHSWPGVGPVDLTYTVPAKDEWESHFMEEGTILPRGAPGWYVDVWGKCGMQDRFEHLKKQLPYLIGKLQWFEVNGERCCYWEKPLEGRGKPAFAGDVTTLREVHGWGIADVMLALYEQTHDPKLLAIVEGVLNWTRYNICTRNDISDVPEAMFTIGWGATRLCLRYHRLFRDDPKRRGRAEQALSLAHSLAYRYLPMFLPDTAEDDCIDGTFLIEPNSARPWTGMPCANECSEIPRELLRVYVATGDPILLAYVRGMVERWHLLYQDEQCLNTAASDTPFTECWGLFDGCAIGGRDRRATYGGLDHFSMLKPVGDAMARVVCGEAGAAVFDRRGMHTQIAEYRASRGIRDGLSFRLQSELKAPFELDVTVPNWRIDGMPVLRERGGEVTVLRAGVDYTVPTESLWDVAIRGVRGGDVIAIGKLDRSGSVLNIEPVKGWSLRPRSFADQGLKLFDLSRAANWAPGRDWDDNASWAPCTPGHRFAYGVPFFLIPAPLNGGRSALRDAILPLACKTDALALVLSGITDASAVTLHFADGHSQKVSFADTMTAWKAWPAWFTAKLTLVPVLFDVGTVTGIDVRNAGLWAVTAATNEAGRATIAGVLDRVRTDRRAAAAAERLAAERRRQLSIGYALVLEATAPQAAQHCYAYLYFAKSGDGLPKGGITIPAYSFLEYDVMIPFDSIRDTAGIDLTGGTLGNLRDTAPGTHPASHVPTRGQWVHVRRSIDAAAGKTFDYAVVATDGGAPRGPYRAYFREIAITDADGKVCCQLYDNGPAVPAAEPGISPNGGVREMQAPGMRVVPMSQVKLGIPPGVMQLRDGVAKDDFSGYGPGSTGIPNWTIADGSWTVVDGHYVGFNCSPQDWIAHGALAGDPTWTDYELKLRFSILQRGSDWRDGPWIGFRCSARQRSGYSLNFHDRNIALHKSRMGRHTSDSDPLAVYVWQPDNAWHDVRILARGERLEVDLDGKRIMTVIDRDGAGVPAIPGGAIVLCARRYRGSIGNTEVAFDDVVVRLLNR